MQDLRVTWMLTVLAYVRLQWALLNMQSNRSESLGLVADFPITYLHCGFEVMNGVARWMC